MSRGWNLQEGGVGRGFVKSESNRAREDVHRSNWGRVKVVSRTDGSPDRSQRDSATLDRGSATVQQSGVAWEIVGPCSRELSAGQQSGRFIPAWAQARPAPQKSRTKTTAIIRARRFTSKSSSNYSIPIFPCWQWGGPSRKSASFGKMGELALALPIAFVVE